jgi:hypothetical protein
VDPFTATGEWLRCSLHAHTTASDGEAPPAALAAHYERAGYDVLATTDHWHVTQVASDGIVVIPSCELNATLPNGRDGHVLAYGIPELPERREPFASLAAAAEWIDGTGGVAYLAHPRWTGAGVREVLDAPALRGIEVFNAGCEIECSRGLAGDYWDDLLAHGRPCFGLADRRLAHAGVRQRPCQDARARPRAQRGGGARRPARRHVLRLAGA